VKIQNPIGKALLPTAKRLCKSKQWKLGAFLGAGATAAVFEINTADGVRALKLYVPSFLRGKVGELAKQRLELVIKQLRGHSCPHLIKIDEGGEAEGTLYLVMQRAPGRCLGDVLRLIPGTAIREIIRQIDLAAGLHRVWMTPA
jgi:hypothetical protein